MENSDQYLTHVLHNRDVCTIEIAIEIIEINLRNMLLQAVIKLLLILIIFSVYIIAVFHKIK